MTVIVVLVAMGFAAVYYRQSAFWIYKDTWKTLGERFYVILIWLMVLGGLMGDWGDADAHRLVSQDESPFPCAQIILNSLNEMNDENLYNVVWTGENWFVFAEVGVPNDPWSPIVIRQEEIVSLSYLPNSGCD